MGEMLPDSGDTVMGFVTINGCPVMCQLDFYGNDFSFEFRMGARVVHCSHWLPITREDPKNTGETTPDLEQA